jgi:hypothetical protein
LATNLDLLIGRWGIAKRACPFVGQLDELAIYDHALSASEIAEHVQAVDWDQVVIPVGMKKDI